MTATGYQSIHPDITLNFMLNRMRANVDTDDLARFANDIAGIDDWVDAAMTAARHSAEQDNHQVAAAYFRGAEFFMAPEHPDKAAAFDQFHHHFNLARPEVAGLRRQVSWGEGQLAVIDIPAEGAEKDVIVGCSGFDGLIEEMYVGCLRLAAAGYRVVLYEGPGQGAALRHHQLTMIHDWERAVARILDELEITSCTLMGVSLGGYLAPRAAAFEPRVRRLIAWSAMADFLDCFRPRFGDESFAGLLQLLDNEQADTVNELLTAGMAANPTARWSITHGIHTCGGETPYDFLTWARELHLRDVSANITQDTLIMAGNRDHLVPRNQVWDQAALLTDARSTTVRLFTEKEHAAEHCQVTNQAIVHREILSWLALLDARDK